MTNIEQVNFMIEKMSITDVLKYPFNRMKGLLNFYWSLIPILGYFVFIGYYTQIIKEVLSGNKETLPVFGGFGENLKSGFMLFLASLCLIVIATYITGLVSSILACLVNFALMVLLPIQIIQYIEKGNFAEIFNYKKAADMIVSNIGDYIVVMLKTIAVFIVLTIASIPVITMVVTIPAMIFSSQVLLLDFYSRAGTQQPTQQ